MLTPGTILNHKYKIIRMLGQGGFAYTYEAVQETIMLRVCIKELPSSDPSDNIGIKTPVDSRNGIREGQILASIHSSHVVGVLDYFEEENNCYIVLEYLEGLTLQEYVKVHGPIPSRLLFSSIKPLLSALSQIHAKELIHRDIAPDNIMVVSSGSGILHLKLFDFGTARKTGLSEYTCTLKEGYSPIEQLASDESQGAFTDLYALSGVLYYCLTGRKPESAYSRLLDDDLQKPSALGIPIDPALEDILMTGLSIQPEKRYQSADDMLLAIEEALPDSKEEKKEKEQKKKKFPLSKGKKVAGLCSAFAVLLLLLFSFFHFYQNKGSLTYDPEHMYKVTLTPTDEFTVAGYNESIRILKERLDIFSKDSGSYSLEEKDGILTLLLNKEDFPQNEASDDNYQSYSYTEEAIPEYLLRAYLSRAAALTLSPSLTSDDSIRLLQDQDFTVTVTDERALASADVDISLPEDGSSAKILSLQFTDSFLAENASTLKEWNNSYILQMDSDCSPPVTVFTTIPKEDGSGFFLISGDEDDKLFELLQYNLTHAPLEHSFTIAIDEQTTWQKDSSSFGNAQVRESALSSAENRATYYLQAMMSDGEMLDCIDVLQKRLDTLDSSYAIGQMDSLTAVTSGCDAPLYRFLAITGTDSLQYTDIADLLLCGNSFYLCTNSSSDLIDQTSDYIHSCSLNENGLSIGDSNFAEQIEAQNTEDKVPTIYLVARINAYDSMPLMVGTMRENGVFLFTAFANGESLTSQNRWVANLISTCIKNQPPVDLSAYHAYLAKKDADSASGQEESNSGDANSSNKLGLFDQ